LNTVRPLSWGRPWTAAPSTPYLIRRKAPRAQQSPPRRHLVLQDMDMPWAQSEDSQGRRPRPCPTSCSSTIGDKEDQLFSPGPGGEETTCRHPARVTLPSLIYKRRWRTPYMGIGPPTVQHTLTPSRSHSTRYWHLPQSSPSAPRDLGAFPPFSPQLVPPTTST